MSERGMTWVAYQLARTAQAMTPASIQRSPRIGRWRNGSASEAVFVWLSAPSRRRVWWCHEEIMNGTACTGKAVDWALRFLRSLHAVEVTVDPRCARYQRYRVSAEADIEQLRQEAP